jgi:hypothetical protein
MKDHEQRLLNMFHDVREEIRAWAEAQRKHVPNI